MKLKGTAMFLFICFLAFTCRVNGDLLEDSYDSVREMLLSLSKGEIDKEEINFVFEDLGIEIDEDADLVLMDYSTKVNKDLVDSTDHRRSKRSTHEVPFETIDVRLNPIVKMDSTTVDADLVYSPSFSLSKDASFYTFIIGDKQIYHIKDNKVIALECSSCQFAYSGAPEAKVVRTTVFAGQTSDHAFVVQVTLRDAEGDEFKHAYFTAWKVSIETVSDDSLLTVSLSTAEVVDFQVVKSPRTIAPDNSYSRVSMLELGTTDNFLTASFHKLESEKTVDGPHLTLINADRTEIPIYNTILSHPDLTNDLKDLKLVKVYGEDVYFLYVINTVRLFIFRLEPNGNTFDISLIQKVAFNGGLYLNGNSDSIATTITIVRGDGKTKTFIYNNYDSFVEMRHFSLDIAVDTWRQVSTNISPESQSREQELVIFQTTGGEFVIMRHVMPGVYEFFDLPSGLSSYLSDNPNWKILDIGRFEKDGEYEYYLLMLIDGTSIDYIRLQFQFVNYNIESLNDASLCLQDLENLLVLDKGFLSEIANLEDSLISLDSGVTAVNNAILSAKTVTVNGASTFNNIEITMHSDSGIVYDSIDYNIPTSKLTEAYVKANKADNDPDHIFADIVFADGPFVGDKTFSITAPTITLDSSRFTTLSTRLIGSKATNDLVHNLLMLEGDQDILCNFEFTNNLKVTGNTFITTNASPDGPVIVPSDFIDISEENSINLAITANTFKFATDHIQTFNLITLNSIELKDILTIAEMDASTSAAPVSVSGVKTISNDIVAENAQLSFIGTRSLAELSEWYNSIIWNNKESQTFSVNTLNFQKNIVANTGMIISTINDIDVTTEKLNDLFLDINADLDSPIVINGNVLFNDGVRFDKLDAPLLNAVNPSHYLMNVIDQTITAEVNFNKLVTTGNVEGEINGFTLTNAVRVDIPQTIETLIEFSKDITVNTALNLDNTIELAGIDFSEVGRIKHVYEEVLVSNSISLIDTNVPVTHILFDGVTVSNFNTDSLRDEYLMTDIDQTLPNLVSIGPNVAIKNLVVHSTLDGISLNNVLKTSGDQEVSTSALKLTGQTKFYQNIIMSQWTTLTADSNNADINGIKIRELRDDILCDKSETSNPVSANANSVLTIDGTDGLIVASYFDVQVNDNFKVGTGTDSETGMIVYKDFGAYKHEVVQLGKTNTFYNLVKYTKPITTDSTLSFNIPITGSTSAKLNGQNIKDFSDSVVKKNGDYAVTTPVTIVHLKGRGELSPTSTFDGMNLHDSYHNYLINDKTVAQTVLTKLRGPDFQFTTLNLNPASEDNYFNDYNFVDYTATLLTDNNVQGTKVLSGILTVNGNIIMNGDDNNFFGIDIAALYANTLFKAKEQTITVPVTAKDITSKNIETHKVNDNEFAYWCFRDEVCIMPQDSTVTLSGITAKFANGLKFRGSLNSKPVDDRITALSTRSISSITSLSSANKVNINNPVENGNTLSYLLTNAVRYSVRDQTITNTVTFNNPMHIVGNLDIDSKVIKSTVSSANVNFVDIDTHAAFLNRVNTFVSGWTVDSITVAGSLNVNTLVSTEFINELDLQAYMDSILIRSSDTSYTQTMTGDLVLSGGLHVASIADIKTSIDGVNVLDFVTKDGDPKHIFLSETPRLIPSVTLNVASVVEGDVAAGTNIAELNRELTSFFDSVVYAKNYASGTQVLDQDLTFSNTVAFTTLTANVLNGINTAKFILRNSDSTQVINQDISLGQDSLSILGNLETSTINGIDLVQTESDILLKDRAETISERSLTTFTKDVTVSTNAITIEDFPTLIQDFINILENFSNDLNDFYQKYVIEPLRPTVEEIYVAKRIGSVRAKYLDEINYNAKWYDNNLSDEILGIDTHQFTDDKYTVKMKLGKNGCDIGVDCQCSETRIATQLGTEAITYDYESTVFTYISDEITLTAVSEFDGTNASCPDASDNGDLLVEAVGLDVPSLKVTLQGTTAENLGVVYDQFNLADVYQVLNFDVVKLGNRHLMAFTTGHSEGDHSPRLQVYQVENGVVGDGKSFNLESIPISLKTISFSYVNDDVTYEVAHVFVDEGATNEVKVYEWKWNVNDGVKTSSWGALLQSLPTPFFTAMEVFKATTSNGVPEKVHLALAYQYNLNFVNYAILDIFEYNVVDGLYVYSTVYMKHRLLVDLPIRKIKAMKFTDYTTLAFSTNHKIQIVNFIPNVGYDQISEYEIHDDLVDWTLFQESLPKTMSNENLSNILFMIKMKDGVRSSEALRIGTVGKLSLPDLEYKPDNLGF